MSNESNRFRVLSLDGGGIKRAFTAAVLAEWGKHTGRVIADHVESIACISTRGIIALWLGLGLPAGENSSVKVGVMSSIGPTARP
jgi:patatin-like phospholipase/acyl hydrolase